MPRKPADLDVAVAWRIRTDWGAQALLKRAATHAAQAEGFHAGSLSIAVVGARAMRRLHADYMNIDAPTDVLTFDLGTDPAAGELEGEIVVCSDVARKEAASHGGGMRAARAELALYVVHGVLHLAGYDDHDPAEYERMHAREDALLDELGLGRVFARSGSTSA
jgi:probable rRNA maturation factor